MNGGDPEATEVTCRLHGPMRLDFTLDAWICKGFDGEGCERRVHMEELHLIRLLHELDRRCML